MQHPTTTQRIEKRPLPVMLLAALAFIAALHSGAARADEPEPRRYIIVAALESETPGLAAYAPIVYTGVGKVLAAVNLYEAVLRYKPELVINYGTAGTVSGLRGLHRIGTIVERDMDARPLGFPRGVAPWSGKSLPKAEGVVLGTGDSFVTDSRAALEGLGIRVDLVDMEAYALQAVCERLGVDLVVYKYVSDEADSGASADWTANVAKGAGLFADVLKKEYGKSTLQ